jgi:hypothetical protein
VCACAQTDVVAIEQSLCVHSGDCKAKGACGAQTCGGTPSATAPAAQVGDGCSDADPTAQAFRFALCSCTDLVSTHALIVDVQGASGKSEASVGIDGSLDLTQAARIDGSLQVAGAISGGATPQVAGSVLEHANPACNCATDNLLDIPALTAAHASSNDDAARGLDPRVLDGFQGAQQLSLEAGTLYLSRIAGSGPLTLKVQGAVVLLVGAEIALDDAFTVELAGGATLDLFVAGTVRVTGALVLGDAASASRVRVYVGGTGTIDLAGDAVIAGPLYAPRSELVTRGRLEVYGPLFVRRAAPGGELRIHYAPSYALPAVCLSPT